MAEKINKLVLNGKEYEFRASEDIPDVFYEDNSIGDDWVEVLIDKNQRIIRGTKPDGTTYISKLSSPSLEELISSLESEFQKSNNVKTFRYSVSGDKLILCRKYSKNYDFRVTMDICNNNVNKLASFNKFEFVTNTLDNISPLEMIAAQTISVGTDWIGPYHVRAVNNADGTRTTQASFTGGWHGYNGNQTGSGTARTDEVKIYADGKLVTSVVDSMAEELTYIVTNYIQATNTCKEDGSGREVLKEIVTYKFTQGKVYVNLTIEALEDIVIELYYGMQTSWTNPHIRMFANDRVYDYVVDGYYGPNERVNHLICFNDETGHNVIATLDNEGLGIQTTYNPLSGYNRYCFCANYSAEPEKNLGGKCYYMLISGRSLSLQQREVVYWSGNYEFTDRKTIIQ